MTGTSFCLHAIVPRSVKIRSLGCQDRCARWSLAYWVPWPPAPWSRIAVKVAYRCRARPRDHKPELLPAEHVSGQAHPGTLGRSTGRSPGRAIQDAHMPGLQSAEVDHPTKQRADRGDTVPGAGPL